MNIVSIEEPTGVSRARIRVDLGFNCFAFQTRLLDRDLDLLWAEPAIETDPVRPSGSGIPLLFPFPGRIRGSHFDWNGQTYPLEAGDGRGNAIHGFVHERPWRIVSQTAASVTAVFQASVDDPDLLGRWPADFAIEATYRIEPHRLVSHFTLSNPDTRPLPCGFGTHPYFRLPLGGSSADSCRIRLPATRRWELVDMIPTGWTAPADEAVCQPDGAAFGELSLDDVYGALQSTTNDGHFRATIDDPESNVRLTMCFESPFRELVVYTPSHRQAICIEPYSLVPASFHLPDALGMLVLAPGEAVETEIVYDVRKVN